VFEVHVVAVESVHLFGGTQILSLLGSKPKIASLGVSARALSRIPVGRWSPAAWA